MEYKEQMRLYIENLKNSIKNNKREIKFLQKSIKFYVESIEHNEKINEAMERNLSNAIKEYNELKDK